jgi:uncharacterized membrane protein YdjX (TVP38/TMEM64 family)
MQMLAKHTRPLAAILLIVLVTVCLRSTGFTAWFDREHVAAIVASAGPFGPLAFVALFVGAVALQVPGLLFVAIAPAFFSLEEAWLLSVLASNLAVVLNFEVVRRLGGQPLAEIESKDLRKLFVHLEERPVRTVLLLRMVTVMFPPVTSALALTGLRARDHFLGSLLGMLLPITALVLATRFLVAH